MSKQIFVSHSKYDKEMVTSFDRVFARTGVRSVCMEFEKMSSPEWRIIKDAVSLQLPLLFCSVRMLIIQFTRRIGLPLKLD